LQSILRLNTEHLREITCLKRASDQVKWFQRNFGIDVPHDKFGPIMTEEAFQKLLEKRLGIGALSATPATASDKPRPTVTKPAFLK